MSCILQDCGGLSQSVKRTARQDADLQGAKKGSAVDSYG
jgi:hypothetical protein